MKVALLIFIQIWGVSASNAQTNTVSIPYRCNDVWSVADEDLNILFEPKFQETYPSSTGIVRFKDDGKFGFCNLSGGIILPAIYDQAYDFIKSGGKKITKVTLNDSTYCIDDLGLQVKPTFGCGGSYDIMVHSLSIFEHNERFGLLSMSGDTLSKAVYKEIIDYYSGTCLVAQSEADKFGFLNRHGTVYPFTLDSVKYVKRYTIYQFYEIYEEGQVGILDSDG